MKKLILLISYLFVLFACSSEQADNETAFEAKKISPVPSIEQADNKTVSEAKMIFQAPSTNLIISVDDYEAIKNRSNLIIKKNYSLFHIEDFTQYKGEETQFEYYSYPLKVSTSFFKLFLILEDYESEWSVWLATYTPEGKFINAMEIYYDNAEGCWTQAGTIDFNNKSIQIKSYNCGLSDEENARNIVEYEISEKGRFYQRKRK